MGPNKDGQPIRYQYSALIALVPASVAGRAFLKYWCIGMTLSPMVFKGALSSRGGLMYSLHQPPDLNWSREELLQCVRIVVVIRDRVAASLSEPALHCFGGITRHRVEADFGLRSLGMHDVDQFFK
jgi:hypothetical protein